MSFKSRLRVGVFGASGRMGAEVLKVVQAEKHLHLIAIVDDRPLWAYHELKTRLQELHERKPQVIIDFSSSEGTIEIATWCAKNRVALVSGTTGLSKKAEAVLKAVAKKVPVFTSPNMSIGVNAFSFAVKAFAQKFPDCEIEIEEIHHKHKKDKPSGTAKFLREEILSASPRARISKPVSLRGGEIFGIHKVYFFSTSEWVCFEHHATDRSIFAKGAVSAAEWLVGRKSGHYSMKDFLKG